ncbi:MAG: hypothetical protein ACREP9_06955, partial [Candidatus Dormibacteraceae bacterium]
MHDPIVLNERQIRDLVEPEQALVAIREVLVGQAMGCVTQPPPFHLGLPGNVGEIHGMGAYIDDSNYVVVKMATGWPGNTEHGTSPSGGLSVVFDASSGQVSHLLMDNGWLTDYGTGIAGA